MPLVKNKFSIKIWMKNIDKILFKFNLPKSTSYDAIFDELSKIVWWIKIEFFSNYEDIN